MKRSIPIGLVLLAFASTAVAAPRGAGSKITGVYTFDVPATVARSQFYRSAQPAPATVATVPSLGERSFSYEPSTSPQPKGGPCQSGLAVTQSRSDQAVRSFSYEPGSDVRTYNPMPRRNSISPAIRGADSKIKGQY